MEFYVAVILALALGCVAGVQYFYLLFIEARCRQQVRRIAELEKITLKLADQLQEAETRLELERQNELWPEVIDGGDDLSLR